MASRSVAKTMIPEAISPSAALTPERRAARVALVEQHIRLENEHNLEEVLRTFGNTAHYDDEAWGEHYEGANGVRAFYEELMRALPDLVIEVQRKHVTDEAVLVEVVIRGTHLGPWRGLPATGRRITFPLCGVYTFDGDDRLAGERIYYDRATVLRQVGVFHEPQSAIGMLSTLATHPVTIAALWQENFCADEMARRKGRRFSSFGMSIFRDCR